MKLKITDQSMLKKFIFTCTLIALSIQVLNAQIQWSADGNGYYAFTSEGIDLVSLIKQKEKSTFLTTQDLIHEGTQTPIEVQSCQVSPQGDKLLIFANTERVWRENTKGDYWIYTKKTKTLEKLGTKQPVSSLMFAKFSPDGKNIAYVSNHNIYIEKLVDHSVQQITNDGGNGIINGTFDWVYEVE